MVAVHRREHLDSAVDPREPPVRSVEQYPVKLVHAARGYGHIMRVDVMTLPRTLAWMGHIARGISERTDRRHGTSAAT
jgi:hypothetical protein